MRRRHVPLEPGDVIVYDCPIGAKQLRSPRGSRPPTSFATATGARRRVTLCSPSATSRRASRPTRASCRPFGASRSSSSRRDARARRRVRLRQERHRALDHAASCRRPAASSAGSIELDGRGPRAAPRSGELRQVRGGRIAMVFQDSMTSLNPLLTVGRQITESLEVHLGLRGDASADGGRSAARGGRRPGARAAAEAVSRISSRAGCASASRSRSRSPRTRHS